MLNLATRGNELIPDIAQKMMTGPKFLTNRRILWLRYLLDSNAEAFSVARYVVNAMANATNGVVKLVGSAT